MALGRRKARQEELCVATTELPKGPGHPFHTKLNAMLVKAEGIEAPNDDDDDDLQRLDRSRKNKKVSSED